MKIKSLRPSLILSVATSLALSACGPEISAPNSLSDDLSFERGAQGQIASTLQSIKFEANTINLEKAGDSTRPNLIIKDSQGRTLNPKDLKLNWSTNRPTRLDVAANGTITAKVDNAQAQVTVSHEASGLEATLIVVVGEGSQGLQITLSDLSKTNGQVGDEVVLTGSHFSEATSVQFNGSEAHFTVDSETQITATVPGGASDGPISVSNSESSVSSSEDFEVTNTIWFVDADASGNSTGADWTHAYTDLQSALGSAASGDEIWVAEGSYTPSSTGDQNASFQMLEGVTLYGGFNGSEKNASERDWESHTSILSGDLNGDDTYNGAGIESGGEENSYHVVMGADSAILDGFTIQGGNATLVSEDGAGLKLDGVSPSLEHLIFKHNAAYRGGGLFISQASPNLNGLSFESNYASYQGGGLGINASSNPLLINVNFENNSADFMGGGLYIGEDCGPTLDKVELTGNSASSQGGGVASEKASPSLVKVVFNKNSAGHVGGGMYNIDSNTYFSQTQFIENTADSDGGGVYNADNESVFERVVFVKNVSGNYGGGLFNSNTSPEVNNVVFVQNQAAGNGGGMANSNASPEIKHVTFSNNTADNEGSALYFSTAPSPSVTQCIFWSNQEDALIRWHEDREFNLTLTDSIVKGLDSLDISGTGNLDAAPLFQDSKTPVGVDGAWFSEDDGLQLKSGSPAIDSGSSGTPQDILDKTRDDATDAGAYEYQ